MSSLADEIILIPEKRDYDYAKFVCQFLSGYLPPVTSNQQAKQLYNKFKEEVDVQVKSMNSERLRERGGLTLLLCCYNMRREITPLFQY